MTTIAAKRSIPLQAAVAFAGAIAITLCAQIRVDLPFTPVPMTGQTFAVILWGLLFGSRAGMTASAAYLTAGALGLPVFAGFASLTALWGPTSGYLIGFIPAAWLAGFLKEHGWADNYLWMLGSSLLASLPILVCGVAVMLAFVGVGQVWEMGVVPFLVGDVVKCALAAGVATALKKK